MKIEIPSFNRKKEFLTMLNDYEENDPSNAEFYQEAKKLSIDKVLIISDQDNIGSIKIIENNGFKHKSTVISKYYNVPIVRYWFHF